MRAILVTLGSRGDLFPAIGLGRRMRDRGHEVILVSSGNYEELARDAGLQFAEVCDARTYDAVRAMLDKDENGRRVPLDTDLLLSVSPGRVYRVIEANYQPGATILGMAEFFTFGAGGLAKEKLGVPYFS